MRSRLGLVLITIVLIYVMSYGVAYSCRPRGGAANLPYFSYTRPPLSDKVESLIYHFYFPIYKAHRLIGAQRHFMDRRAPADVSGV